MKKNTSRMTTLRVRLHDGARRAVRTGLWAVLCALLPPGYVAQAQANETVPNSEVGHSTRAWLELQRSNAQAAPAQPMLGAEAGHAYQRYLKSFDTPIPASFGSSVNGNGMGGQSGLGGSTAGSGTSL